MKRDNDLVGYVTWSNAYCIEHWNEELSEDVGLRPTTKLTLNEIKDNREFALSHGMMDDDEWEGMGPDLGFLYHVALVDTGSAFPRERGDYYSYDGDKDDEYCSRCGIALADVEVKETV